VLGRTPDSRKILPGLPSTPMCRFQTQFRSWVIVNFGGAPNSRGGVRSSTSRHGEAEAGPCHTPVTSEFPHKWPHYFIHPRKDTRGTPRPISRGTGGPFCDAYQQPCSFRTIDLDHLHVGQEPRRGASKVQASKLLIFMALYYSVSPFPLLPPIDSLASVALLLFWYWVALSIHYVGKPAVAGYSSQSGRKAFIP